MNSNKHLPRERSRSTSLGLLLVGDVVLVLLVMIAILRPLLSPAGEGLSSSELFWATVMIILMLLTGASSVGIWIGEKFVGYACGVLLLCVTVLTVLEMVELFFAFEFWLSNFAPNQHWWQQPNWHAPLFGAFWLVWLGLNYILILRYRKFLTA